VDVGLRVKDDCVECAGFPYVRTFIYSRNPTDALQKRMIKDKARGVRVATKCAAFLSIAAAKNAKPFVF
jgi:hypothetical protein